MTIGSSFGPIVVNVAGNLSNTSDIEIAASGIPARRQLGPSTLNVAGTLTNQATGTLDVNNPQSDIPSPGALNVERLVNYGTANFQPGTASTAQFLQNNGTLNILADTAGDIASLAVGTLKTAGGVITTYQNGGLLTVGSGTVPAGTTGYYQFTNGVLDAAGGVLEIQGPRDLNGTLDVMLGDGYKPVGTVFTVLFGGDDVPITGAFSNVEGLVFDGGREKYVLSYYNPYPGVYLTVENNTTPNPAPCFLRCWALQAFSESAGRGSVHTVSSGLPPTFILLTKLERRSVSRFVFADTRFSIAACRLRKLGRSCSVPCSTQDLRHAAFW